MNNAPLIRRAPSKLTLMPAHFICIAPTSVAVSIVGDFNQWHPNSHPMQKNVDGSWHKTVGLPNGHHRYAFLIDGVLKTDPNGSGVSRDDSGNRVSIVSVS